MIKDKIVALNEFINERFWFSFPFIPFVRNCKTIALSEDSFDIFDIDSWKTFE